MFRQPMAGYKYITPGSELSDYPSYDVKYENTFTCKTISCESVCVCVWGGGGGGNV